MVAIAKHAVISQVDYLFMVDISYDIDIIEPWVQYGV